MSARTIPRALLRLQSQPTNLVAKRWQSSYQPPTPPPSTAEPSNPHRDFYKSFGRPMAKVFLGALCTYQIMYWSWKKLESFEVRDSNEEEIKKLEAQLRSLKASKDAEKIEATKMTPDEKVAELEAKEAARTWKDKLGSLFGAAR